MDEEEFFEGLFERVENWVLAEYAFRLGKHPYSKPTTDAYLEAEDELREWVTGETGLAQARHSIRGITPGDEKNTRSKGSRSKR